MHAENLRNRGKDTYNEWKLNEKISSKPTKKITRHIYNVIQSFSTKAASGLNRGESNV